VKSFALVSPFESIDTVSIAIHIVPIDIARVYIITIAVFLVSTILIVSIVPV